MSCDYEACCEQGVFRPIVHLRGSGGQSDIDLGSMKLCAEHSEQITTEILITDSMWLEVQLAHAISGVKCPVRSWTTISWKIVGPEDEEGLACT